MIDSTIRIALRALAKNKMRAGLTVLGVVIGIAAVTAMVSVGMSASELVQGEFQNLGTNVIVVIPGNEQARGGVRSQVMSLTPGDAQALSRDCTSVLAATPVVFATGQAISGNSTGRPAKCLESMRVFRQCETGKRVWALFLANAILRARTKFVYLVKQS